MKGTLHYLFTTLALVFFTQPDIYAQNYIHRGTPVDSVTMTFEDSTSLTIHSITGASATLDTTGAQLWRIGKTVKPFFSIGDTTKAIMTDTSAPYTINANDWFTLTVHNHYYNPIIYFKHKYQTTAGHDGGIVEISFDGGNNWDNVKGQCNMDSMGSYGMLTDNFYTHNDTLQDGQMAFSGTSNGWQYSGIQFLYVIPIANKSTAGCMMQDSVMLRFRFVSDSTADTLDGWIIDDIEMKVDFFGGKVNNVAAAEKLNVSPNPVQNGIINFPALANEGDLKLGIYNAMGIEVLQTSYKHQLTLDKYPPGIYFYRVTGGTQYYSGRIIID